MLVIRSIKFWTGQCDWLLEILENNILIGCLSWKLLAVLLLTNQNTGLEILGKQSNCRIQGLMLRMTKITPQQRHDSWICQAYLKIQFIHELPLYERLRFKSKTYVQCP